MRNAGGGEIGQFGMQCDGIGRRHRAGTNKARSAHAKRADAGGLKSLRLPKLLGEMDRRSFSIRASDGGDTVRLQRIKLRGDQRQYATRIFIRDELDIVLWNSVGPLCPGGRQNRGGAITRGISDKGATIAFAARQRGEQITFFDGATILRHAFIFFDVERLIHGLWPIRIVSGMRIYLGRRRLFSAECPKSQP